MTYEHGDCAICLGAIQVKSYLDCGHVFCLHCMLQLCGKTRNARTCPLCRQSFNFFKLSNSSQVLTVYPPVANQSSLVLFSPADVARLSCQTRIVEEFLSRPPDIPPGHSPVSSTRESNGFSRLDSCMKHSLSLFICCFMLVVIACGIFELTVYTKK